MSCAKILELGLKGWLSICLITTVLMTGHTQNIGSARILEFKYGFQIPSADMADRFGSNSIIGINFNSVAFKSNFFLGAGGMFLFGGEVKEDVLAGLRSFDGAIIGIDGRPGDVSLKERGYYFGLHAGKIFKMSSVENNLTGIRAQIGGGFLQHKIRVQDNGESIVALEKDKLKGYDRLTNGPAIHMAIGYQYQNPKNNFHFNIMADLFGGRTAARRSFDIETGGYLEGERTEILAGLSVSYIVSISRSTTSDHIYY